MQEDDKITGRDIVVWLITAQGDAESSSMVAPRWNANLDRTEFLHLAVPMAGRAGPQHRRTNPSLTATFPTEHHPWVINPFATAIGQHLAADLQVETQVVSSISQVVPRLSIKTEVVFENTLVILGVGLLVGPAFGWMPLALAGAISTAVFPMKMVEQGLVGFKDLAEARWCQGILGIVVGMASPSQLTKGFLDLFRSSPLRQSQRFKAMRQCRHGALWYA
jgi:hypothetical protein